jgi:hypothetical protein
LEQSNSNIEYVKHIVKKPRAKKNYINGEDFHKALTEYYIVVENSSPDKIPQIPKYIGECIIQIADKLTTKIIFASYSFKEDMAGDAIEKMLEAVKYQKFDVKLSNNPVGYFSQITWNCFLQRIAKEKKESYIKHKNFQKLYASQGDELESLLDNEEHNRVINDFENPRDKSGYAVHRNLSYEKNKKKPKKDLTTEPFNDKEANPKENKESENENENE